LDNAEAPIDALCGYPLAALLAGQGVAACRENFSYYKSLMNYKLVQYLFEIVVLIVDSLSRTASLGPSGRMIWASPR
jgi:hypothetical protein